MVYNFKVFKKCAPNGKVTLYMGKRDFVDHVSGVEPIGVYSKFACLVARNAMQPPVCLPREIRYAKEASSASSLQNR